MAKITSNSYPLDAIRAAKTIMNNLTHNSELLESYIIHEVISKLDDLGIVDYEKNYDGIVKVIDNYIKSNKTTTSVTLDFIDDE